MARTKFTPRNKPKSSGSEVQSGPSALRQSAAKKKPKKSTSSSSTSRGRRSEVGEITSSTDANERENRSRSFKRVVAAKSLKAWKPLRTSTKRYALQFFDTAVEMLLTRTNESLLGDLQLHLGRMRRRFADRLDKASGPVNNVNSYNNLHRLLDTSQQEADARIQETLKKQLEEEERECRDLEEEMETYQLYSEGASELHPLLKTDDLQGRSARIAQ